MSARLEVAVGVIVGADGTVLLGQRVAGKAYEGWWEFPGGKVEPGEAPALAAARECLEEAGIAVRVGPLLDRAEAAARSGPLEVLFFAATPLDDRAAPTPPFAWVAVADLAGLRFPPANAAVLARLAQGGS
jgi:8-oxo-dGTP diphosphatase